MEVDSTMGPPTGDRGSPRAGVADATVRHLLTGADDPQGSAYARSLAKRQVRGRLRRAGTIAVMDKRARLLDSHVSVRRIAGRGTRRSANITRGGTSVTSCRRTPGRPPMSTLR